MVETESFYHHVDMLQLLFGSLMNLANDLHIIGSPVLAFATSTALKMNKNSSQVPKITSTKIPLSSS